MVDDFTARHIAADAAARDLREAREAGDADAA
jgi:hypothetical protein